MSDSKPKHQLIIAIDGPAASGKGTLSRSLAKHYDLARLETGLIYRAVALKIINEKGEPNDKNYVLSVAEIISFDDLRQEMLRSEEVGKIASQVAVISQVREVLLEFQRNFAAFPPDGKLGAVLDGRDIGTVVCPYATHKIFLSASLETRARRRFKELQKRGPKVIHSRVLQEIKDRDTRDELRSVSPLVAAEGALVLDTSDLSAREVFEVVRGFISGQDCSER